MLSSAHATNGAIRPKGKPPPFRRRLFRDESEKWAVISANSRRSEPAMRSSWPETCPDFSWCRRHARAALRQHRLSRLRPQAEFFAPGWADLKRAVVRDDDEHHVTRVHNRAAALAMGFPNPTGGFVRPATASATGPGTASPTPRTDGASQHVATDARRSAYQPAACRRRQIPGVNPDPERPGPKS